MAPRCSVQLAIVTLPELSAESQPSSALPLGSAVLSASRSNSERECFHGLLAWTSLLSRDSTGTSQGKYRGGNAVC